MYNFYAKGFFKNIQIKVPTPYINKLCECGVYLCTYMDNFKAYIHLLNKNYHFPQDFLRISQFRYSSASMLQ